MIFKAVGAILFLAVLALKGASWWDAGALDFCFIRASFCMPGHDSGGIWACPGDRRRSGLWEASPCGLN